MSPLNNTDSSSATIWQGYSHNSLSMRSKLDEILNQNIKSPLSQITTPSHYLHLRINSPSSALNTPFVSSSILIIQLAQQRRAPLDPVLHRLVTRQQNWQHEVGRVTRRGQCALSLARLVDGAAVPEWLLVDLVLLGRFQPDDGHGVVEDLRELLRQDAPVKRKDKEKEC